MHNTRAWIIAGLALVLGACASTPPPSPTPTPPKAADLSGTWLLTTQSPVGAEDATMTVRQTGSALAGTITREDRSVDYTGTVNGSVVAFDFTFKVHGTDMKFDYTGMVEGDTMKGKTVFGRFGEGSFTAKRQ